MYHFCNAMFQCIIRRWTHSKALCALHAVMVVCFRQCRRSADSFLRPGPAPHSEEAVLLTGRGPCGAQRGRPAAVGDRRAPGHGQAAAAEEQEGGGGGGGGRGWRPAGTAALSSRPRGRLGAAAAEAAAAAGGDDLWIVDPKTGPPPGCAGQPAAGAGAGRQPPQGPGLPRMQASGTQEWHEN